MTSSSDLQLEDRRLRELESYDILDSLPERSFDRITLLAKTIFDMPIALVSLVAGDRQWFKSRQGFDVCGTPRSDSFCQYTIQQATPLVIPDATLDSRVNTSPLVLETPGMRFYAGAPLITPNGYIIGSLCVIDLKPREFGPEQLRILEAMARIVIDEMELRRDAGTDSLTGALTRRRFSEVASTTLMQARARSQPTSFLMVDIDHFKSVNDQHGHRMGDRILAATVKTCRSVLGSRDYIARLGGEEFGIVLAETSLTGAIDTAHRLKSAIAAMRFEKEDDIVSISVSIGVATWNTSDDTYDGCLARADEALYAAKNKGRNRVLIHDGHKVLDLG